MSKVDFGRIPSLDGIRGLGVISVAYAHLVGTGGFAKTALFDFGSIGLRFFFVLSGFLITTLLIGEYQKYGNISLKRFYFRRTMRIFPPFYAAIVGVLAGRMLGWIEIPTVDVMRAAGYVTNYFHDRSWWLGHTWSLAVEEQFYLLWPAILVLLGMTRALGTVVIFFFFGSIFRIGTYFILGHDFIPGIGETFPTIADSMAAGCALALARNALEGSSRYQALLRSSAIPVAFITIFAVHSQSHHPLVYWAVGMPIENICITLCVHWAISFPEGKVGKILNFPPIVYLGTISYSWYIWQQIFLNRHASNWVNTYPQNIIISLIVGSISYYVIERSSLKLRERLERRWFPRSTKAVVMPALTAEPVDG